MLHRIVNVSGGKDSTACYLLAIELGKPFRAVFCDTGHEHQTTYDFLRTLPQRTGGPEIEWIRADFAARLKARRSTLPARWREHGISEDRIDEALQYMVPTGNPFVDASLYRGMFPSVQRRYCTKDLKVEPMERQVYLPLLDQGHHVIAWQGVRAAESVARASMRQRQKVYLEFSRPRFSRHIHVLRPILHWTLDDVLHRHGAHGIKANPLYAEGFTRVGCFPCIYAQKNELALIAQRFPDAIERLERWESLVAKVSKKVGNSFFYGGRDPRWTKGDPTGIRQILDWAETAPGRQEHLLTARSKA